MLKISFKTNIFSIAYGVLFLLNIYIYFPGIMSADSIAIYSQALKNSYSLHHPPFMGLTWHYLDMLYKGPALVFIFNMLLLWGSVYILTFKIFKEKYIKWFCLIIPFIPHVLVYSGWIWKDIIFTYGYIFISAYLSFKTVRNENLTWRNIIFLIPLLIYFTEVKYQAQFILPFVLFWMSHLYYRRNFLKKAVMTISTYILIMAAISYAHKFIAPDSNHARNHSWQFVKIYDLSGTSINSGKILVPKVLWKDPNLKLQDVERKYELAWEPLVVYEDSPFRETQNNSEREFLIKTWKESIIRHPFSYLKHRFHIWSEGLIFTGAGSGWIEKTIENKPSFSWLVPIVKNALAYIFIFPIQLLILTLGLINLRKKRAYAIPILYLNSMSLTLLGVLFIFSLAAVPRYIYFSMVFFIFSIPFSIKLLKNN